MVYFSRILSLSLICIFKYFQIASSSNFSERSKEDVEYGDKDHSHSDISLNFNVDLENSTTNEFIFDIIDGDTIEAITEDKKNIFADFNGVNENYLEERGLRSLSTTPFHSSSSRLLVVDKSKHSAKAFTLDDNSAAYYHDTTEFNKNDDMEVVLDIDTAAIEIIPKTKTSVPAKPYILCLPEEVLANILDYCLDDNLLNCRLSNRFLKNAIDKCLDFISVLTLKPDELSTLKFFDKYSLVSIMMPFYCKQTELRDIIQNMLTYEPEKPWHTLSLFESRFYTDLRCLSIFSNEFISTVLIPKLSFLPQGSQFEPSPLFLLGEALLKSKRFALFETALLPFLNSLSVSMLSVVPMPPVFLNSPGFMAFTEENQFVLGATLHAAINFNLTLTVFHLIRLEPKTIQIKNHCGKTALLQIISNLWKWQVSIPGPGNDDLGIWMNKIMEKFYTEQPIQSEFLMNSRLLVEMFLGIVKLIFLLFPSTNPKEVIDFMGFNEEFSIYKMVKTNFYKYKVSLLQELVSAQQYDIIISVGFRFGYFIEDQPDFSPLHLAAERNSPIIVMLLLQFFPQINVNQISKGYSVVGTAVNCGSFDSLRILLNDPRIDPNLHQLGSPLTQSIEFCSIEIVKLLLNHPLIDLHHQIHRFNKIISPIERAVNNKKWKILELILHKTNQFITLDSFSMNYLKVAERMLTQIASPENYDLLMLIREIIFSPNLE